ncbi:hypothetical protein ANCCEY_09638, partial [Ancylostoma ceylanicum]
LIKRLQVGHRIADFSGAHSLHAQSTNKKGAPSVSRRATASHVDAIPHRSLINPFRPDQFYVRTTANRRRWIHVFPVDEMVSFRVMLPVCSDRGKICCSRVDQSLHITMWTELVRYGLIWLMRLLRLRMTSIRTREKMVCHYSITFYVRVVYDRSFCESKTFELSIKWFMATGQTVADTVYTWQSKFYLFPVPEDPIALPKDVNSNPLRCPIRVQVVPNIIPDHMVRDFLRISSYVLLILSFS